MLPALFETVILLNMAEMHGSSWKAHVWIT